MRKTSTFTIPRDDPGRDKGKTFLLTEMSASKGEAWAMRVLLALMGSNVQLPEDFETLGMAALAELGMKALAQLRWETAEPLLLEMMECVQFVGDPMKAAATTRPLWDSDGQPNPNGDYDIEEVATRLKLRMEVWKLHMGFLEAVAPSLTERLRAAKGRTRTKA